MVEKSPKRSNPEPFTKDDYEAMYWALVDMLTSSMAMDDARRTRLRDLVARLSEHVRFMETGGKLSSGFRRKVDVTDRKGLVREKLLSRFKAGEVGTWAIYGEDLADDEKAILLTVFEGTYADAVEQALNESGFITKGMGGQIDPLGV